MGGFPLAWGAGDECRFFTMLLSNSVRRLFLVGACALGAAASSFAQVTREEQAALTPQAAFTRLAEGHQRFLQGRPLKRDLPASVAASARGQYPAAMVISCIDSRTAAEFIFDQGTGDLFCGRIAGNFVDDLMLGSIEFGLKVARAPLVVVLGHTECGAVKGACSGVKLGHLTTTLAALQPAIQAVPDEVQPRTGANRRFVELVTAANVRLTVKRVRTESDVLATSFDSGKAGIIGGVYDVATGRITWLDDTAVNVTVPTPREEK